MFNPVYPEIYDSQGNKYNPTSSLDFDNKIYSSDYHLKSGSMVPMTNINGHDIVVPAEKYQEAASNGYKFTPTDYQYQKYLENKYSIGEKILGGLSKGVSDVTLGGSDFLARISGMDIDKYREMQEASGGLGTALGFAGILGVGALTGGTSVEGSLAKQAAGKIASMTPLELSVQAGKKVAGALSDVLSSEGAETFGSKIAKTGLPKLAGGAVTGAMIGAGQGLSEASLGDTQLSAENLIAHIGPQALLGSVIGLGTEGVLVGAGSIGNKFASSFGNISKSLGDKSQSMFEFMTGVPKSVQDSYLEMKAEGANPRPLEDIVQEASEKRASALDLKKSIDENYKDNQSEISRLINNEKLDIKDKTLFYTQAKEDLKSHLEDVSNSIGKEMTDSKGFIKDSINKIFEDDSISKSLLKNTNELVDGNITDNVSKIVSKLREYSGTADPKLSEYVDKLANYIEDADRYGKRIVNSSYRISDEGIIDGGKNVETIKGLTPIFGENGTSFMNDAELYRIKKNIDTEINYSNFGETSDFIKQKLRSIIDSSLKERNPLYKEAMGKASTLYKLLETFEPSDMSDINASKISTWLKNPEKYSQRLDILKEYESGLEKHGFGSNWQKSINDYIEKSNSVDSLGKIKGSSKLEDFNKISDFLKSPENHFITREHLGTDEGKQLFENMFEIAMKKHGLLTSTDKHLEEMIDQQFKHDTLGNIPNTESSMMKLFSKTIDKDPAIRQQSKELIEHFFGKDAAKEVEQAATRYFLENKEFKNGAANTVAWAIFGNTIGKLLGKYSPLSSLASVFFARYIDVNGPKVAKFFLDKMSHIGALEKVSIENAKYIDSSLSSFLGTSPGEYLRSRALPIAEKANELRKDKLTPEKYASLDQGLSTAVSNTPAIINHIGAITKYALPLTPMISNASAKTSAEALGFLNSKIPRNPIKAPFEQKYLPSKTELLKFGKYYSATMNPLSVFDSLKNGTISNEEIESLRSVYPKMYSDVAEHLFNKISDGVKLTHEKKMIVSKFLGVPIDNLARPEFTNTIQSLLNVQDVKPSVRPSVKMAEHKVENMQGGTEATLQRA